MTEYDKFQKSLRNLEAQFNHNKNLDPDVEDWIRAAIKESIIWRFRICCDCLWRALKSYLAEEEGLDDVPLSPKPLVRMAGRQNLLSSEVDEWMGYIDTRTFTIDIYSSDAVERALEVIEHFIDDAIGLYQTMSGDTWE